ncbi:MAG: hypothetical protein ACE5FD_14125, partial [Anaerolineae bacterium]
MDHAFAWIVDAGKSLWPGMDGSNTTPSPQLVEANRRLYALRAQAQAQRQTAELPADRAPQAESDPPWDAAASQEPATMAEKIAALPGHLGWGSEALTAVLRRRQQESECVGDEQGLSQAEPRDWLSHLSDTTVSNATSTNPVPSGAEGNTQTTFSNDQQSPIGRSQTNSWVKLYPDIGLGMLRQEMTAPGRLWLILRYLDQQGSGRIRIDIIRQTLTPKSSTLRMCGKRQLRNLLRDGEGVFWTRDKEHVWLFSAARVAYALDVERLTGQPVGVSVPALLEGIGSFRAHLYAAFHSGRTKETPHGTQAMPIARDTLAGLSGVGQSSQRTYEARANVKVQANFAVGEVAREENREDRAWSQGQALFELKDYRGEQGKKGKIYLAWQLPNTYIGKHQHRPKGRQKRINRKLKDLVMKGMPGNVG